ncbi:MAG TPA: BBE domain-containing protein [Trebonia sp.]
MTGHSGEQIRGGYGNAQYKRLAGIKAAYDPGNFFRRTLTSSQRMQSDELTVLGSPNTMVKSAYYEAALFENARLGDERAFAELTGTYQRELRRR